MASRKFTGARPVRYQRGEGWIECLPHRAQRWQAVLEDRLLHKAPFSHNKHSALGLVTANVLRHAPLPRDYKLGKQMGKRDES